MTKHTPWKAVLTDDKTTYAILGWDTALIDYSNSDGTTVIAAEIYDEEHANVLAAAPLLLAYAECEAAYTAPKATFSTINVVLRKYGWTDKQDRRKFMNELRARALGVAKGGAL